MSTKITILIVNYNTSEFIESTLYCLNKITTNAFKVLIVDNFYSKKEKKRIQKICNQYTDVQLFLRKQSQLGSMGHGEALDFLAQKVKSPYFAVLDADATFLKKGWDNILISEIDSKYKVIGTQLPTAIFDKKKRKEPLDFPKMYASLFETKTFKELNITFKPLLKKEKILEGDTGYRLRIDYLKAHKKGKLLYHVYSLNKKDSPFFGIGCAEYYLLGYESIIASHFWRGSSLNTSPNILQNNYRIKIFAKLPLVGNVINKLFRNYEKRKWIQICKKIVDNKIK